MIEQSIKPSSNVSNWISIFNSVSKFMGFSVTKSEDTFFSKFLREIVFLWLLCFAALCTVMAELWCMQYLDMKFDAKKLVIFSIDQLVNLSPFSCLVYFRLCDSFLWKIILKVRQLEENLVICDTRLEIGRIGCVALLFWCFQFFTITSTMVFSLWPTLTLPIRDTISMFYFEAWVTVPFLQFIVWICFLCYVLYCLQLKIVETYKLEFLTELNLCKVEGRLDRAISVEPEFIKVGQIKRIIDVMKQVLNIAKELSAVYGIAVLLYIINYLSRVTLQVYDILDKDAQNFTWSLTAWNVTMRIMFILPGFICCERLSCNINEIVGLIREIVTLHQPSCLDNIFQSLTLRLQHQSTTMQICGFLNLTYRSFLTIMTTAITFLVLQLQFSS